MNCHLKPVRKGHFLKEMYQWFWTGFNSRMHTFLMTPFFWIPDYYKKFIQTWIQCSRGYMYISIKRVRVREAYYKWTTMSQKKVPLLSFYVDRVKRINKISYGDIIYSIWINPESLKLFLKDIGFQYVRTWVRKW